MALKYIWLILILCLSAVSCKSKKEASMQTDEIEVSNGDSTLITYEKTPCFGHCPIFKLSIYKSGYAVLRGVKNTEMIGLYTGMVNTEQIDEVFEVANEINFFTMYEVYDGKVTDLPSTIYMLNKGEKKQVLSRYQGPEELKQLSLVLDHLVKEVKWTQLKEEK